jgi:hypothetical protein
MVLFMSVYPIAMCMGFVKTYVDMRLEAWRLTKLCKRPKPQSAEVWMNVYVCIHANMHGSMHLCRSISHNRLAHLGIHLLARYVNIC